MKSSALFITTTLVLSLLTPLSSAAGSCGDATTAIARIQGEGDQSPITGHTVTVEGILSLDARENGGFRGFYLQQADDETDGNPATSEALFVYTRRQQGTLGQRLRVTGEVREFHGLTELVNIRELTVCGPEALPEPVILEPATADTYESLENMRVAIPTPLTVIDNYNLARYGELTLATGDRVIATEYLPPGPSAGKSDSPTSRPITLDDGRGKRDPRPVPWPPEGLGTDHTVRTGDTVRKVRGVLDFRFGQWRVQPESTPEFLSTNAREPAPEHPGRSVLRVMTLNLANLFNGDGRGGDFPTPRGATSESAYRQQQARLVSALTAPDPDILAVSELENDGYGEHSAAATLAQALGPQWRYIRTPGKDGNDAIRTLLYYRQDRVVPVGNAARLTGAPFHNAGRPPLAQAFRLRNGKASIRVVVPHLKSKSCRGATGADRDQGDGQGCYAHRRTLAAGAIADWLDQLPGHENMAGTLITGDFNSYTRETPLQRLRERGYTSMVAHFHPCTAGHCPHYTYRYKGRKGSLDHALASAGLAGRVVNAVTWRINADEPRALGYQYDIAPNSVGPWRSSDHNPVIVDIRL
ncbi:MAG: ExeM/NucH family extracellular endonuclease [Marinobacter sp.]|nr:ExeM/NucH family extracellular endonuclease [Marinobacter sp.]